MDCTSRGMTTFARLTLLSGAADVDHSESWLISDIFKDWTLAGAVASRTIAITSRGTTASTVRDAPDAVAAISRALA